MDAALLLFDGNKAGTRSFMVLLCIDMLSPFIIIMFPNPSTHPYPWTPPDSWASPNPWTPPNPCIPSNPYTHTCTQNFQRFLVSYGICVEYIKTLEKPSSQSVCCVTPLY